MEKRNSEFTKELARQWDKSWPSPIVPQKKIAEFTGGLVQKQTLINLCNSGNGPEGKFYIRNKAVWKKEDMLSWLLETLDTTYTGTDIKSHAPNNKKAG